MTTEKIEVKLYSFRSTYGHKHVRWATELVIDGFSIRFTEKLTRKEIARYLESRQSHQHQAQIHAEVEALGG